jgi:tetratricopeptide (TPR) repeat protein
VLRTFSQGDVSLKLKPKPETMIQTMKRNRITALTFTGLSAALAGSLLLGTATLPAVAAATKKPDAPLLKDLGSLSHPITTRSELAQRYFDQGLMLAYNFNHAEAARSFQAAAEVDPDCAMAWWGLAYSHGPNINLPMMPDSYPKAWTALQKAIALKPKASARERAYIDALTTRYVEQPVEDRSKLDLAFVEAMRAVATAYPDDLNAQTLFCEAGMTSMPWNYWTPEREPKPLTAELLRVLHTVLRRDPDHPGANHFFIHAVESGPTPEQGIPAAERIERFAPAAGHLVHMASHIWVRVGEYDRAVTSNERATKADENYLKQVQAQGAYPAGYYPHNVHFLWYANSLRGHSRDAIKAAKKVADYALDLRCGAMEGGRQRYLHALALTQFAQWDKVLALPLPGDDQRFDQGMHHYARCLAYLAKNDRPAAQAEYALFQKTTDAEAVKVVENPYFPAGKVVEVANEILLGKLALHEGDEKNALQHLGQAVAIEDEIPYMEPPFWYYSAKWSLGAAQVQTGNYVAAEATFRKDLEWLPRNGWALHGLAATLRNQGKTQAADSVYAEFQQAWKNADVKLDWSMY